MRPVAIGDIVHQAASATAALVEGHGLNYAVEIPDELPLVNADPDRIMQVIINLVSNAVKFTQQGTISICARNEASEVVVDVVDQGIGIAISDQALLFEKFSQVGDTLTAKPQGTGLGLAISKEIIEHHGGRIWLESRPGKGSKFSFALPVYIPEDSREIDHQTET
jgi:signal transduction histidine kinase